jgi:hypothetical protein
MCAQFRNIHSRGCDEDNPVVDPSARALVVVPTLSDAAAGLERDLFDAQRQYNDALDSLHHQRVVIEMMEEAMHRSIPPVRLKADAATQTVAPISGCELPFRELVLRKLQVARMKQRRVFAQQAYQRQLQALESELEQLRSAVSDTTPQGVAMVGVGREGTTVMAVPQ